MAPSSSALVSFAIPLIFGVFLRLLFRLLKSRQARKPSLPYPPGPAPKFLIGNAFDVPRFGAYKKFAEWGKEYKSGLIHISAAGQHIVIVNDRKIAEELFEKRSVLYNDRPEFPVVPLMGLDYNFTFLKGDAWLAHRRICQKNFNSSAAKQYQPMQTTEVHTFLRGLLNSPSEFTDHYKLLSIALQLSTMYGFTPTSLDDEIIRVADESSALSASLLLPGATLINIFPILRHVPAWVPFASGQRRAKRCKELTELVKALPLNCAKKSVKEGKASPSLVTEYLEQKALGISDLEQEKIINNVAWTVYNGGSDTTRAATGAFIHIMAKHPEIQRRAQAEIDRIVGCDRLPTFADRTKLPYIDAIYREMFRYHPITPMAIPHCLNEDDVYEGYFLPKGAWVVPNIYAMARDENVYSDPSTFHPDRFLDANGELNDDSRVLTYGFGRRVCVGKAVASASTWLTIVSFLACFNVGKAKDDFGNEIEIDDEYEDNGAMIQKKHFACSITPRSEQARSLILETEFL
ncbi:cytochrome P450 [Crepidotus variabilis]|uniref:Cytochrome P450 n=1 Tax=Crepidotus variabilis TaxID=179855 RepID=A0A9P6E6F9_9AGAR|nr:cytochrome P450 [Crepidotus variabilis]